MKIIESSLIKEKAYIEKLENGLTVIIIPKEKTKKKYVIWGTHFGSIDNHFIEPSSGTEVYVPDGVAHFLEHKMFEQENGKNSLDILMALGVDANAYTTNDHTAYLFETTNNFYEALDELMDYVQNPYFTDENVEKEKGIIGQEIGMYDDEPGWQLYMNALDCMYKQNPIKIDIAGTVESISKIDPDVLYKCYNTFYNPSNMALVVCGDFNPEDILNEIKRRLIEKPNQEEIRRIYPENISGLNKKYKEVSMMVSQPLFMFGFKDENLNCGDIIKKHIAIEIVMKMLVGKSSKFYKKMYEQGLLTSPLDMDYEFTDKYAHAIITGQSKEPEKIKEAFAEALKEVKNNIDSKQFERIKKKIYGNYVIEYNSVADISKMFLMDFFKGVNPFDYIEKFNSVTIEDAKKVLNEIFDEKNMVMSVVKSK